MQANNAGEHIECNRCKKLEQELADSTTGLRAIAEVHKRADHILGCKYSACLTRFLLLFITDKKITDIAFSCPYLYKGPLRLRASVKTSKVKTLNLLMRIAT
jgi:hypothetical protein